MKHLILGAAGHIDHGKTTLVKALTGFDCDTHPEEKLRGITINLGFTHLDLPDGTSLGVVDAPGHADFVNTMVAGASGIDILMLVIAADSGVAPQTVEHFQIARVLGVKRGVIVLAKTDLVDAELLDLAEEDVRDFVSGSFLENAPVVKVSAKTGDGIPDLIAVLMDLAAQTEERPVGDVFRMFVDRLFTVQGFGAVINGSVISGKLHKGELIYLLPGAQELRVRRLEHHGVETDEIIAGERASINPVGLDTDDFKRGMCVADRILPGTSLIDARLTLFPHNRHFDLWTQVVFLLGSFQAQARIHLLDCNRLEPGDTALVQIRFDRPGVCLHGDRFVIRSSSGDITLGGGEVIDAHPLHHRRRPEELIRNLQEIAEGGLVSLIAAEVRKRVTPIRDDALADILSVNKKEVWRIVSEELPEDLLALPTRDHLLLTKRSEFDRLEKRITRYLEVWHKRNPLDETGVAFEELMGLFGVNRDSSTEEMMRLALDGMLERKVVRKSKHAWALGDFQVSLTPEDRRHIDFIENLLMKSYMTTPLWNDMVDQAHSQGIGENKLKQILRLLVNRETAYNIDGNFIRRDIVDSCRITLLKYLVEHPEGATVATFRDLVRGNRKICLLLIGQYDSEGITVRQGDYRVITRKGLTTLHGAEPASNDSPDAGA
jgi:selenocysteine-specific elongation factor